MWWWRYNCHSIGSAVTDPRIRHYQTSCHWYNVPDYQIIEINFWRCDGAGVQILVPRPKTINRELPINDGSLVSIMWLWHTEFNVIEWGIRASTSVHEIMIHFYIFAMLTISHSSIQHLAIFRRVKVQGPIYIRVPNAKALTFASSNFTFSWINYWNLRPIKRSTSLSRDPNDEDELLLVSIIHWIRIENM